MTAPKNVKTNKPVPQERKADESKSNPLEAALSPNMKAVAEGAGNITLADVEKLKDFQISDTDAAFQFNSDFLAVNDLPSDPDIGHLVFRWLSPSRRASVGMGFWQWVKGELAQVVRKKGIIKETIGGGASTSVIVNGDLMLAFAPRQAHVARKRALQQRNAAELDSILDKATVEQVTNKEYQTVDRDVSIRKKYGEQEE